MEHPLLDRLKAPGPKKILALDGGGIRGALTLGYLKHLEDRLREKTANPDLLLCDYFDLIGGTSTGSIIAAGLAIGMTVEEIKEKYMELGGRIFGDKRDWWNPLETLRWLRASYDYKVLEDNLRSVFGNLTLGDHAIRTGLCIVAKRADTNSTWPLINHPEGKYYDTDDGRNKNIPLWQAVRASTAAPTYFAPQMIDVGGGQYAAFVDGGVSMANNPALTLLMVATLKGFPFRWPLGEEHLTLVSVGTGYSIPRRHIGKIEEAWLVTWAKQVPDMLMQDASWQNQIILQWLSRSPTAFHIDGEMGTLEGDLLAGKPLLSYYRYNFPLTENSLNGLNLGRSFKDADVDDLIEMSNAKNRFLLYEIGEKAGRETVKI